jgi:hypothetical protein
MHVGNESGSYVASPNYCVRTDVERKVDAAEVTAQTTAESHLDGHSFLATH